MGRKIPTRKHRGIRDPVRQQQIRYAAIKDKINHPPTKVDHQKVSRSFAKFVQLKELAKSGKFNPKKRRKDNEDCPEKARKRKVKDAKNKNQVTSTNLPAIKKVTGESEVQYLRRVNRITEQTKQDIEFQNKYSVDIIKNVKTGEIKLKKRPKNEIDEMLEASKTKKKGAKPIISADKLLNPTERKEIVAKLIAEKKAKKAKSENIIEEFKKDYVAFGEVVHAPPQLAAPRHGLKSETVPRPGKKNLLLHSVLAPNSKPENSTVKKVDLKGKRKDLPLNTRKLLENKQQEFVELYRQIKKAKNLAAIKTSKAKQMEQ